MNLTFHYFSFGISSIIWSKLFWNSYKNPTHRWDNKLAIINNSQLIFFNFLTYLYFFDYTPNSFVNIPNLNGTGYINLFLTLSIYFSLVYNLFDLFIEIYKMKWAYVFHHLSLVPFFFGYLGNGYFYKLNLVYGLLELTSLTFNLRQIYPKIDTLHKLWYTFIRILTTPIFIYLYVLETETITTYFIITGGISTFLLLIFNGISIYLSLKSLISKYIFEIEKNN